MKVFDILNNITNGTENLARGKDSDELESSYESYFINKGLSQHADTVMFANDVNLLPDIPKLAQYEYLHSSIRKRARYGKWAKSDVDHDAIELISNAFGVGRKEAIMYHGLLTPEQLQDLVYSQEIGGPQKR